MKKLDFNITSTSVATMFGGDGRFSLCEMAEPREAQEFFDRFKAGFLQWRRPLSDSMHSLSIFAPIPRRDVSYRDLIQNVCELWNSDAEIAKVGPSHVEIALTNRGDSWVGCTTAANIIYKSQSEQGAMHFVDYIVLMKDINAQISKANEDEKSRRRATPVMHPVELPATIKSEIASYLRLEYGERARDKDSLKARDLAFDGEFVVDGSPRSFGAIPPQTPRSRIGPLLNALTTHIASA